MSKDVPDHDEKFVDSGVELMLAGLPPQARALLRVLSPPHWIDEAVLGLLSRSKDGVAVDMLKLLEENGLLEKWSDGSLAVRSVVRRYILDGMATGAPDDYRELARTFANIFAEAADNGGDVYHHIESVFHRLAADPLEGEVQLLADGVAWKSEPLNAFDALARLIDAALEQKLRGFLSERAADIVSLLQLYLPAKVASARREEEILRNLAERKDLGALFDAELALRVGLNYIIRGRTGDAHGYLHKAYAGFKTLKLIRGEGDALRALGRAALREDNLAAARRYFIDALRVFQSADLTGSVAHCVKSLAEATYYLGRFATAETLFEEALTAFQTTGGSLGEANTRVVYSQLLAARGQFGEAHNQIEQARHVYGTIDQGLGIGNCLKNSGVALFEEGRYNEAIEKLSEARRAYADWGSVTGDANCGLWSAACLIREAQPESALPLLDHALESFTRIGDRFGQASVCREQAIALSSLGDFSVAIHKLETAESEFRSIGNLVEANATAVKRGFVVQGAGLLDGLNRAQFAGIARRARRMFKRVGHLRYLRDSEELQRRMKAA